jgi:hypothetical protein
LYILSLSFLAADEKILWTLTDGNYT